jgi:Subtilase family
LDLVAPGLALPTTVFGSNADRVTLFSGCSAATPVAAGIASLLLSIDPLLTHDQVSSILTQTAEDQVGPATEDTPGRDDFFGFGRVNLNDALADLVRQVAVDVRPQQCPNRLRADMRGNLPVAVAGTHSLDVRDIDPRSIRLAGVRPKHDRTRFRDVTTPFEPFLGKENAHDCTRDRADGFEDLLLRFSNRRVARALDPVANGEVVVVPLTGKLEDGTPILGEDVVVVIKPRRRAGAHDEARISSLLEDGAELLADMEDQE